MLPLPCVKTIRHYIAIVGIKSGFDVNFVAVLKRKLQGKSEFQRHGTLLLDEIQVRKRKTVNTHQQSSELASHGLVFMFCLFGESYAQPVAVAFTCNQEDSTVSTTASCDHHFEGAGALIDGIVVCDRASPNRTMWTQLEINKEINNRKHFYASNER